MEMIPNIPTVYNVKKYRTKITKLKKGKSELVSGGSMVEIMVSDGYGMDLT